MKRLLYILCMAALVGCSLKEDTVFNQTPDQRLDAVLQGYQNALISAPNGWLMTLASAGSSGTYRFWVTFNDQNRVTMLADMDATKDFEISTSTIPKQSSYRIKAVQTPTLMFDTYGYVHLLADPQGDVNGGVNGQGLQIDFEYSMLQTDNGQIYLLGNHFGSRGLLTPATAAQAQAASKGALSTVHINFENYMKAMAYPTVLINDRKYDLLLGARTSQISYVEGDVLTKTKVNTYLDLTGTSIDAASSSISLLEPKEIGGNTFEMFKFNGMGYVAKVDGEEYEVYDNIVPCFALSYGLGKSFTAAKFDFSKLQGTVKEPFLTDVYKASVTGLATDAGRYIDNFIFTFMTNSNTMKPVLRLYMLVRNPASPTSSYYGTWYYNYTDNGDGTLTFTDRIQGGGTNEFRYEPNIRPLLDYFCGVTYTTYGGSWSLCVKDVVTPRTFRFDWVKSETMGLKEYLVGYFPTESGRENNVFVGILSEK